jgi:hypothetical protein
MALADDVRALVDAQCPGWGEDRKAERISTILKNNICYLDSSESLCVKSSEQNTLNSMLQDRPSLTTRVSAGALETLTYLRELRDRGVLSPSLLIDIATVEAEEEPE